MFFLMSPIFVYLLIKIFNLNSVLTFTFMSLYLAILGIIFATYILIDILRKD